MKIGKLEDYLTELYKVGLVSHSRQAVLLLGLPGIGKSMTCWKLARSLAKTMRKEFVDYDDDKAAMILSEPDKYFVFVDLRLTECEPSDLCGLPHHVNGSVRFSPLLWARCLSKTAGLLLLDELTNIQRPDVITVSYKLVFDREAGFTKFHDDVMIVACGNRPEHSSVATMLPTPLLSRMLIIDISPPSVDDWADWMYENYGYENWDRRTYIFLKRFQTENYLIKVPPTPEGLDAYPVPRTWTALATLMSKGISDAETFRGLVGDEVGMKFNAFIKVDMDIDELMQEPAKFNDLSEDARYMTSLILSSWIGGHMKNLDRAFPLFDVMSDASREYTILTCMSIDKRKLVSFLKDLFSYDARYEELLSEVTLKIVDEIAV